MGSTSSLDLMTAPFESGMPRLALQSAVLPMDTLTWCGLLLTLLTGGASSPDPEIAPLNLGCRDWRFGPRSFQSRVWSIAYSPDGRRIISGSGDCTIRTWDSEVSTEDGKLREGRTYPVQSLDYSFDVHTSLVCLQSPTWMVGSGPRSRVGYSTGYPATVVQACICLPSRQSPLHLIIVPFLLTLTTLPLEPRSWTRMFKNAPS